MKIDGITLPDLPSGMFDTYPYGAIYKSSSDGADQYIAVALAGEVGVAYYGDILLTTCMEVGYLQRTYTVGVSSDWGEAEEVTDTGWFTEVIPVVWTNHDIPVLDINTGESTGKYYMLNSTVADDYPEELAVESNWLWGVAEQARRLSGNVQRYSTDTMLKALKGANSAAVWENWEGAWIREILYSAEADNNVATIYAEYPSMPIGINMDRMMTHANLPNAISIGPKFFMFCESLKSIDAPLATDIGMFCLADCFDLETVNFPVAETIGMQALAYCYVLASIDLPLVNSIDSGAFLFCETLGTLILRNTSGVCELVNADAFDNTPIADGTGYIYVPSALVDSYKAATNWSTYAAQIRAIEDYPDICGTTA